MRNVMVVALGAAVCSCGMGMASGEGMDGMMAAYGSNLDAMRAETERHLDEMEQARTMDQAGRAIEEHVARMQELHGSMLEVMGEMGRCEVGRLGRDALGQSQRLMMDMMFELEVYQREHSVHASTEECRAAAAAHARREGERASAIESHGRRMGDGMTGMGMHGGMR